MIEFNGFITDDAERFFWNNSRKIVLKVLIEVDLFILPFILLVVVSTELWQLFFAYIIYCLITPPFVFVPIGKKQKNAFTPKQIFTDDEYIVCRGNKFEEYQLITDALEVIDYGRFYFIRFPFGKKSDKFVCQKNLLIKGTLEQFEALFEGKIVRQYSDS